MATVTSLGFRIWSQYDSDGLRNARRDVDLLGRSLTGWGRRTRYMVESILLLGPAIIPMIAAATAGIAAMGVAVGGAAAAFAVFGYSAKQSIGTVLERFKELNQAREAYRKATTKAGKETALERQKAALEGLTGAQKSAIKALDAFQKARENFGKSSHGDQLGAFEAVLRGAAKALKVLEPVVKPMTQYIGELAKRFESFAGGKGMKSFSDWLATKGVANFRSITESVLRFGKGIAGVIASASKMTGDGASFTGWLERVSIAFQKWGEDGSAVERFFVNVRNMSPAVVEGLKAFWSAVEKLAIAFGPIGIVILTVLEPFLAAISAIADKAPWLIQGLWGVIAAGKVLAFTLWLVRAALWAVLVVIDMSPIGRIILVIGLLVAAVIWLYKNCTQARIMINAAVNAIATAWRWLYSNVILPVVTWIVDKIVNWLAPAFINFWRNVIIPVWNGIRTAIGSAWTWISGKLAAFANWFSAGNKGGGGRMVTFLNEVIIPVWARVRSTIASAWNGIRAAIGAAWSWIQPKLAAFWKYLVEVVAPKVRSFWTNTIVPAFNGVRHAIGAAWAWIQPKLAAFWRYLVETVGPKVLWFWRNIVVPAFNGIKIAIAIAWTVIQRIFNTIRNVIQTVIAPVFRWLLANVIKPVWDSIKRHIATAWALIRIIFIAIQSFIKNVLAPVFRWLLENVIRPVWNGIRTAVSTVWNAVKAIFGAMKTGIDAVARAFQTGQRAITTVWNKIRDTAKAPVRFLIDTVWNNGIVKVWNSVVSKIPGIGDIKPVAMPKGLRRGGVVPGYQSAKKDDVMMPMRRGEGVLVPEAVRGLGTGFVNGINRVANSGGVQAVRKISGGGLPAAGINNLGPARGHNQGYALGGVVDWFKKQAASMFVGTGLSAALDKVTQPMLGGLAKFGKEGIPGVPYNAAKHILDKVKSFTMTKAVELEGGGGGDGNVTWSNASERLNKALTWARTQHGKPYQWGGGGNPSWDCSGFMAGIENVIRGLTPGRRYTTHQFLGGTSAPDGWVENLMSPFQVGVTHGGVGHMAGSLLGVNVESAGGGKGVRVGSSARGANDSLFTKRYGFKPVVGEAKAGGGGGAHDGGGGGWAPVVTTSYWDNADNVGVNGSTGAQASGKRMSISSAASSYLPLGSKIAIKNSGGARTFEIEDLGPNAFVYARHPGKAVIDINTLAMKMMTGSEHNVINGYWKLLSEGSGRTLYGKRLRGFMDGGQMRPGELATVGERGPELFKAGPTGGTVYPNGMAPAGGSGGNTYEFNFNDKVYTKSDREFRQLVVEACEEAERKNLYKKGRR